jgi:3-methyladenine DNA glycosylase AlkD
MAALERRSSRAAKHGLARYGLPADHALGVSMAEVQSLARSIGRDHDLAERLWQTRVYEARLLVAYVADPTKVTSAQMDRWCGEFDNWGVCDTLCFALFDRTRHAWAKVDKWAPRQAEFVRRGAFALLWGLTVHDKQAGVEPFLRGLAHVENASIDSRPMVKKAVSMALRATGKRNAELHAAAIAVARRLAASDSHPARWIGRHAVRELSSASVVRRVSRARAAPPMAQSARDADAHPSRPRRRR